MAHVKIEPNIYHDDRCTKMPYYVSIMRRSHTFYKKFKTLEEAQIAKQKFVDKHHTIATDHPYVFIRNDKYVIEIAIEKSYDNKEEAIRKATLLQKFIEN